LRTFLRVVYRLIVFVVAALVCLCDFGWRRLLYNPTRAQRADWLQRWCKTGLRLIGTRLEVEGGAPLKGLIVSNHLSYLDILVYSAIAGCTFVSKREVRSWPVFGWIATVATTIYID